MKNYIYSIILSAGSFICFIIFAWDYTYDKDFMTMMHLVSFITWWTCGLVTVITNVHKQALAKEVL